MSALLSINPADADLDGYLRRIAAPYRWDDDPARVEVWALDIGCRWWLLVDGERSRRLSLDEEIAASRAAGLVAAQPASTALADPQFTDDATTGAASTGEARAGMSRERIFSWCADRGRVGGGRVLTFAQLVERMG